MELHVLADEGDLHLLVLLADPLGQLVPLGQVGRRGREAEPVADVCVEALRGEVLGNEVDVGEVGRGEDCARVDVGEQRDLVADLLGEQVARAADDRVGVDPDAAELVHRMLRRLRLQLARRLDERDERDVEVEDVLGADLAAELPDRLEERERLDVPDRAADLRDDDVGGVRGRAAADPALISFVMCGITWTVAPRNSPLPLFAQDGVPDRARAVARVPREVLVDEALVMAEVEVGLRPVLGDEHLAVLERAHRPRIDVEVRVELLCPHAEPPRLEEAAERGGDDPLPEGRDDSARDEDVARRRPVAHARSSGDVRRRRRPAPPAGSRRRRGARVMGAARARRGL